MSRKTRIGLSLSAGAAISGAALYAAFRGVPFSDLLSYLRTVKYEWGLLGAVVALASFGLRVTRWQLLLSPVIRVGYWSAFHPLMIGFMLNCLLPARIGELARPAIFKKRQGVAFSKVLATVAAERVFDVMVLLLSFMAVMSVVNISPALDMTIGGYHVDKATLENIGSKTLELGIVLLAGIALICFKRARRRIQGIIMRLPDLLFFAGPEIRQRIRVKFCVRLADILEHFSVGFELLKSPRQVLLCFGLSLAIWAIAGLSYYVTSVGCPGIRLSFLETYAVLVIICFFVSLPSAPGYWGLWEAGGVFGLMVFGIPAKEALGFTLMNHVFQLIPTILVGLVSLIVTGASIMGVIKTETNDVPLDAAGELG